MAGTKAGGQAAAATNRRKHGDDFYSRIGKKGAEAWLQQPEHERKPKGFAYMKAQGQTKKIRDAGRKGGTISRKGGNYE